MRRFGITDIQIDMANLIRVSKNPQCLGCLRQAIGNDLIESTFPFYRQLRGKKKSSKQPATVNVKLLEDIRGYGRKGQQHVNWTPLDSAAKHWIF